MSTRHLLNLTMGAFAMLLLAALGVAFSTASGRGDQTPQIELAQSQQVLVQDLTRQATALTEVDDREVLAIARQNLARTVIQFDRNLTVLLHGGSVADADGQSVFIKPAQNDMARIALEDGAQLWLETGMPLADLAAGDFSAFSAAGQQAIKNLQNNNVALIQHMGAAANSMRMGIHARSTAAGIARWASAGLAIVLIGMAVFRRKILAAESAVAPSQPQHTPPASPGGAGHSVPTSQPLASPPTVRPQSVSSPATFVSPVNFDTVNASVDQMTVDMNTIAGSTEKMRVAIDAVGNALQGMLYSLNEMAQDTAEGHKIVRSSNNAASFTADAAGDLAASAREMAEVVARVTQLAHKTKNVAAQIESEARHTGKTGEKFTSMVAGEVQGLAQQTSRATREVDQTVANIMLTARQYEEAIGQIIKNVSAINKVSQNLGELMLNPPPRVEPGLSLAATAPLSPVTAPTAEAAATPEPGPVAPAVAPEPISESVASEPQAEPPQTVAAEPPESEDAVIEVADQTEAAIKDAAQPDDDESDDGNDTVFMLGSRGQKPNALNIPKVATPEVKAPATEDAPKADGGSNDNVFMLNGPRKAAGSSEPAPPAEATPVSGQPNVYGLELPDDLVVEPEAEAPATETRESAALGTAVPEASEVPETIPPGDDDGGEKTGSSGNIFMLNKPK